MTISIRCMYNEQINVLVRICLGHRLHEACDQLIEKQIQANSVHFYGALEYDETYLYHRYPSLTIENGSNPNDDTFADQLTMPMPMPSNIAVIDASIRLFSRIFRSIDNKYRLQMLQRFRDIIKLSKGSRQETLKLNILTAVSMALKNMAEIQSFVPMTDEHLKKSLCTLLMQLLCHTNVIPRCVAGDALSRLLQIVNDECFYADIVQFCLDRLKDVRDLPSRAGYCLALGCLHRYVKFSNTNQHLNTIVPVLVTIAQDSSSSMMQTWALHALTLTVDHSGQMFRRHVQMTLELVLHLLMLLSTFQIDLYHCCTRLLASLIGMFGSELRMNTSFISDMRTLCLTASELILNQNLPLIKFEIIDILLQLHFFAPKFMHLSRLMPELMQTLASQDLALRQASVVCLKQLIEHEGNNTYEYARVFLGEQTQNIQIELSNYRSLEGRE
jgi:HEAT repeat-containing protein 5